MDEGACKATVSGVAKSQTRLSDYHFQFSLFSIRSVLQLFLDTSLQTEEAGRLQSMRSLRVGRDSVTSLSFFTFMH